MPTQEALLKACLKYDAMGLDVSAVIADVLHLDDKCGRGWEGNKPGCVRAKTGEGKAKTPEIPDRAGMPKEKVGFPLGVEQKE